MGWGRLLVHIDPVISVIYAVEIDPKIHPESFQNNKICDNHPDGGFQTLE